MAQWWEYSPPTNVARVRFSDSASHVSWVCWFSTLILKVFLQVLRFSSPTFDYQNPWFVCRGHTQIALCKGIQVALAFEIPNSGSRIPDPDSSDSRFQTHGLRRNVSWIPSKFVDSGFHTIDSGFHALDSGFQSLTFAGFWIPDSFTSGDSKRLELCLTCFFPFFRFLISPLKKTKLKKLQRQI